MTKMSGRRHCLQSNPPDFVSPAVRYASVHPAHRQDNFKNRLPDSCLRGRLLRLSASCAQAGQLQEQIARFLSARLSLRLSASCAQGGQVREPNRPTDAGKAGPTPHVTRCTDTATNHKPPAQPNRQTAASPPCTHPTKRSPATGRRTRGYAGRSCCRRKAGCRAANGSPLPPRRESAPRRPYPTRR